MTMSKKKKLVLEGDEITLFIAMCMIVMEDCDGTAEGHMIHIHKSKIEPLFQRACKTKAAT